MALSGLLGSRLEQTETEIRSILIRRGYVTDEEQAGRLYEHLVAYVFRRLCQKGRKLLTCAELAEECSRSNKETGDHELIQLIRAQMEEPSARIDAIESTVAMQARQLATVQDAVHLLNRSMGLSNVFAISSATFSIEVPEPVHPRVPRLGVVSEVQEKLKAHGIAVLVAEPGSGKTQLLLLVRDVTARPLLWLNIPRDSTEAQACILLDAFIRSLSTGIAEQSFRDSLDRASERLRNTIITIEDLPRVVPGGRLATRVEQLSSVLSKVSGQLLISSYYKLPATLEVQLGNVHCEVPRFDLEDVLELLQVVGAPVEWACRDLAPFIYR